MSLERRNIAIPFLATARGAVSLLATTLGLCACNPLPQPVPPLPPLNGYGGAAPRISGAVGAPTAIDAAHASLSAPASLSLAPPGGAAGGGDVSLDFADTDIRAVIAQVLGSILHVDYTIDPSVHGTATLHTANPLNRTQLVATLQALLAQNGAALVQNGRLYAVVPEAATGTAAGTTVVALRYVAADNLARTLQPFAGTGHVVADAARNVLLISGDPSVRDSLVSLARAFDIDLLAGQSYALLPVASGDAKDFASAMLDALRAQSGGALAGRVQVLPMMRMDAVLVVAAQPAYIADARRVYDLVDRKRRDSVRNWHVYYLQNSRSEPTAYVLQRAFTPNDVSAQPSSSSSASPGAAGSGTAQVGGRPGLASGGLGSGAPIGTSGSGPAGGGIAGSGIASAGGAAGGPAAPAPAAAPAASASNPLLGGLDAGGPTADPNTMRIIPNADNHALLVYATPHEQDLLEAMLRKIDIQPLQVRIDATIAEVDLNDQLQYGTQFFFKSGGINGILNNATAALTNPASAILGTTFPGFILAGSGAGGAPIALQALQAVTTVHVLSSPEILVQDNQAARLQVGQLVPYLTSSSQSTITTGSPVINSINYQPTGVIMQVTPRVNSDGLVTLDISQEVSNVDTSVSTTTTGIASPTFLERNVTSRVVLHDGQTVGLAGLIQDSVTRGNSGLPWLKDIPLLGLLAGTQNNVHVRTELLVLITPHVLRDARDAQALTEDLREQMHNSAVLPYELPGVGASGSADPNLTLRRRLRLEPAANP